MNESTDGDIVIEPTAFTKGAARFSVVTPYVCTLIALAGNAMFETGTPGKTATYVSIFAVLLAGLVVGIVALRQLRDDPVGDVRKRARLGVIANAGLIVLYVGAQAFVYNMLAGSREDAALREKTVGVWGSHYGNGATALAAIMTLREDGTFTHAFMGLGPVKTAEGRWSINKERFVLDVETTSHEGTVMVPGEPRIYGMVDLTDDRLTVMTSSGEWRWTAQHVPIDLPIEEVGNRYLARYFGFVDHPAWHGEQLLGLTLFITIRSEASMCDAAVEFREYFGVETTKLTVGALNNEPGSKDAVIELSGAKVYAGDQVIAVAKSAADLSAEARQDGDLLPKRYPSPMPVPVSDRSALSAVFVPLDTDLSKATAVEIIIDGKPVRVAGRMNSVDEIRQYHGLTHVPRDADR